MSEASKTGVVVLGLLALRPRSGYEIKQAVDGATRFFWAASYGQIYPELRRLERARLVTKQDAPVGGRKRHVYAITRRGRGVLRSWLEEPGFSWEMRDEGLLKLFFADVLPPEDALELLRARRAAHQSFLATLRAIRPGPGPVGGEAVFPDVVRDYGIALNEWAIDWCERTERRLVRAQRKRA